MEEASESINKQLEIILDNQQLMFDKLVQIVKIVTSIKNTAFMENYLADIAGTVTAEAGLIDAVRGIKKKII